jgi:pimeloyl-ACP methyl ester carboxylesterase
VSISFKQNHLKEEPMKHVTSTGNNARIHRAVSADGTEIAGRIHGDGPPLVLVHGGMGDGDRSWSALLPFLSGRFTCYCMSTRGRGLSSEPSPADYSHERLVEDVVAFAESVGEPVGLTGYSSGGMYALGAAAQTTAVSAVAVYEPPVVDVTEEDGARFADAAARMHEAVAEGRLGDAARIIIEPVATDDEMAALAAAGYFEAWAQNIPIGIQELKHVASGSSAIYDPSALARITAPVLYLRGSRGSAWYAHSARYLAKHIADFRVIEIAGAAHFDLLLAPEPIAGELVRFFETVPELA